MVPRTKHNLYPLVLKEIPRAHNVVHAFNLMIDMLNTATVCGEQSNSMMDLVNAE